MIDWINQVWVAVIWNNTLVAEVTHAHLIMTAALLLACVVALVKPKKGTKA